MSETKRCQGMCGKELSLSEFSAHRGKSDGLQSACRKCQSEYRIQQRAKEDQAEEALLESLFLREKQTSDEQGSFLHDLEVVFEPKPKIESRWKVC